MINRIVKFSFYLLAFAMFFYFSLARLDNDLGWHLKSGQEIVNTGRLPSDQIYLWTLPGQTWVDHEWLTGLGMFLVYDKLGFIALAILSSLVCVTALWLINLTAKRFARRDLLLELMPLEILALLIIAPSFNIRAQCITFLGLAWLLWWLSGLWQGYKAKYYLLPLVFWLWASSHAGYLFGLIVLLIVTTEDWWLCYKAKVSPDKKLIGWSLLAFVATWLTPYGVKLYSFLFAYRGSSLSGFISEWRPIFVWPISYLSVVFLGLAIGLLLSAWFENKKLFRPAQWLIIGLLFVMSILSVRHFPLFALATLGLIAPAFVLSVKIGLKTFGKAVNFFLTACLLTVSCWLIINADLSVKDPFAYFCRQYPCGIVNYLKDHPALIEKRWLNHYDFGGYLIWTLPQAKLYADGRLPQAQLGERTLVENFVEFKDQAKLENKLLENQIDLVLWEKPKTVKQGFVDKLFGLNSQAKDNALISFLSASPAWRLEFEDSAGWLFVKRP